MLEVARRAAIEGSPVGIELLFTVAEEDGAARRQGVRRGRGCASEFGYVFDHATPIGEVVVASPTLLPASAPSSTAAPPTPASGPRTAAAPILAAAHAIAAMPHGRIDEETTANVGSVHGGVGSTNVVPERAGCWPRRARWTRTRVEDVRRAR